MDTHAGMDSMVFEPKDLPSTVAGSPLAKDVVALATHESVEPTRWRWPSHTHFLVSLATCWAACFLTPTMAFRQEAGAWLQNQSYRNKQSSRPQQATSKHQTCQALYFALRTQQVRTSFTLVELSRNRGGDASSDNQNNNDGDAKKRFGKKGARKNKSFNSRQGANTTAVLTTDSDGPSSEREKQMTTRITQLEKLVAKQTVDIRRLQEQCRDLQDAAAAFSHVMEMLRAAGLDNDKMPKEIPKAKNKSASDQSDKLQVSDSDEEEEEEEVEYEYFDDAKIFGTAPSSVSDAADAAGAAILAGLLGGKQRMLVDVRDSELSRDAETLVNFIELAILPVAAGLEGLKSSRNRVKIVFPTISQLLEYRRTMALAAPEVVALSTLGFDPVEERDNLVVVIAPAPDNDQGLNAMNELLQPPEWKSDSKISQPVVVINHHMVPLTGPAAEFDVMYHLRLLSVQYMSGDSANALFQKFAAESPDEESFQQGKALEEIEPEQEDPGNFTNTTNTEVKDQVLEAAMKHASEVGFRQGLTRAMVIRAFPK
jgi:hypothetical protein